MNCILDTNIFNWLVDGRISIEQLPKGTRYATHVQIDELSRTTDEARRTGLLSQFAVLQPRIVPTETAAWGVSRWGGSKWGEGNEYQCLKAELDAKNSRKPNNVQDALIAEVAIINKYILVTADADLAQVAEGHGCSVCVFKR